MELLLENLRKEFGGTPAVAGVTAVLQPGIYGLLGANGAGKTTLLRMICGVLRPTSGRVCLDGIPIDTLGAAYRDRLGYLPQEFAGYPRYTARDFLLYMAVLKGMTRARAKPRVEELLRTVRLQEAGGKKLRTFSGGMRRRLGIAQALLNEPDLLILDEPTAGLDPRQRIVLRNLITRISENKIVIFATHVVPDIEPIAREVLLLRRGRLIDAGPVARLCRSIVGCVAEEELDPDAFAAVAATGRVVNFQPLGARYRVRYLLQAPDPGHPGAAAPTLEDVYLYHFHDSEKSGAAL